MPGPPKRPGAAKMEIYIRRNKEEFGPFSREMALEYLKQGVFQASDRACYAGVDEWKTVGELLGISVSVKPGRAAEFTQTDKITEFNPDWSPPRERVPAQPHQGGLMRTLLIALNVVLIMIAATVASIRFIGGTALSERCVASLSVELSRLANILSVPSARPAAAIPAPAVQKASTPAPAPAQAPPASTPPPVPAISPLVAEEAAAPIAAPSATPDMAAAAIATPTPTPAPPKPFDPADLQGTPGAWPKTVTLKQPVIFPALYNGQIVGSLTAPPGTAVKLVRIQGEQLVLGFNGGTQTVPWQWTDLEQWAAQSAPPAPSPPALPGPAAPIGPSGLPGRD